MNHEPTKGLRPLISPERPLAGCQYLLARFARLGPLCGLQEEEDSRNEPHSGPEAWIDEALRALAVDDEQVSVPARVHREVLREWDQHQALRTRRRAHRRSRGLAWVVVPAAAAVLLAVAVLQRQSVPLAAPDAASAASAVSVDVPAIRRAPDPLLEESRRGTAMASAIGASTRPRAVPDGSTAYVIVPPPLVDAAALHVVRARMSRTALATLGMPIVDPNVDGLVEVEMLVGEDGVAQSIRYATLVNEQWETGGER